MTATIYDTELPPLDLTLEEIRSSAPPKRAGAFDRIRAWALARWLDLTIVGVITVAGGLVHAIGMYRSPARFDDEGTYTAYAWAVQNWHKLGHYTYWYAHPPLGWLQIATWTWLTDGFNRAPYAVAATREFTFVCTLIAFPLTYGLAKRLGFGRPGAALSVMIFAFSPLAVYFTRAALLDNIVTPWLIAAFFFAAAHRRSISDAILSAICLAIAVLTKETALLYLPALLILLWQYTDRRNRRFTLSIFTACFMLICAAYPLYALIKNELLIGPGHVSLEWAVKWQLSGRTGSGSIFDPNSTAHAVISSWFAQDHWLPRMALAAIIPGLLIRRTRAVAAALAIQLLQLLRSGYLPYPYVIAMIPFAALTIAGVVDWAWSLGRARVAAARDGEPGPEPGTGGDRRWRSHTIATVRGRRIAVPVPVSRMSARYRRRVRYGWRAAVGGALAWLVFLVAHAWAYPLADLRTVDRDAGKAQALAWMIHNIPDSDYVVVDDSFWVDLVRAGHPSTHVVWFTKLDVDKDVHIPGAHQWEGISYIVLDHEDDLSAHVQADGKPSKDTLAQFPTLGLGLKYSSVVASFGAGLDAVTIRAVDPSLATTGTG
jgi:4-amino-4-deoxy-L-arabinose transferase-like glycosyltransferase